MGDPADVMSARLVCCGDGTGGSATAQSGLSAHRQPSGGPAQFGPLPPPVAPQQRRRCRTTPNRSSRSCRRPRVQSPLVTVSNTRIGRSFPGVRRPAQPGSRIGWGSQPTSPVFNPPPTLRGPDSNRRPPGYEPDALPLSYPAPIYYQTPTTASTTPNTVAILPHQTTAFPPQPRVFPRFPAPRIRPPNPHHDSVHENGQPVPA